ncbi:MAG: GTP-dependent dephospho-CoA kinase family protein [Halanaeroarchaeum sp.]
MPRTVATLPAAARDAFKEALGPIYEDAEQLLADAGEPVVAVGDVVTYYLVRAGHPPHLAVVDGLTEREAVEAEIEAGVPDADRERRVENPAGELTDALIVAIREALDAEGSTLVRVDGEEDLATLPAVLLAPDGASVVYGQPGAGMVRVDVDAAVRARMRTLCGELDTDERFWDLVGVAGP